MDVINLLKLARTEDELANLLNILMSKKEQDLLSNRARIFSELLKNNSYKNIEAITGTSSATISKINQRLQSNNALENLKRRLLKQLK